MHFTTNAIWTNTVGKIAFYNFQLSDTLCTHERHVAIKLVHLLECSYLVTVIAILQVTPMP